jgi:16S rRNA G1207 methylase RsmC
MEFITDAGVFSRDGLDAGTRVLLEALPPLSGRVLDLGCGWGALAEMAAGEFQAHVTGVTLSRAIWRAI